MSTPQNAILAGILSLAVCIMIGLAYAVRKNRVQQAPDLRIETPSQVQQAPDIRIETPSPEQQAPDLHHLNRTPPPAYKEIAQV
jgi:hypothetical protein